jgi:hypothetical protein
VCLCVTSCSLCVCGHQGRPFVDPIEGTRARVAGRLHALFGLILHLRQGPRISVAWVLFSCAGWHLSSNYRNACWGGRTTSLVLLSHVSSRFVRWAGDYVGMGCVRFVAQRACAGTWIGAATWAGHPGTQYVPFCQITVSCNSQTGCWRRL